MANYYGAWRTNYIRVTDWDRFKAYVDKYDQGGVVCVTEPDKDGLFCMYDVDPDGGANMPCWIETEDPDTGEVNEEEINFFRDIAQMMPEGGVLVVMESGCEKRRYISGSATAFNWKGEHVQIVLDDIYEAAAKEFGVDKKDITKATY